MEHKTKSLIPLLSIVFLDMIGIGIIIPILAVIFLSPNGILPLDAPLATRTAFYGLLLAAYPFAQFFGAPLLGTLSDQHGRRKLLLISLIGTGLGYLLFAIGILSKNLPLLFASRLLAGFTGGNIAIAYSAVSDLSTNETKSRNFGLVGMMFGFGFMIGPFLGGQLANSNLISWFNAATPFYFAALLSLINIFMLIFLFQETLQTSRKANISWTAGITNLKKAFTTPALNKIFLVLLVWGIGFTFFAQFFQVYLVEKFDFSEPKIGLIFGYVGLWIAFTQGALNRPISKRFRAQKILMVSLLMLSISLFLILIPNKSVYFYLVMPLIALSQGITLPNITAFLSNLAPKDMQGEVMGINQSLQSAAQAIAPLVAGFFAAAYVGLPILIAAIFIFISWILFVYFFREKKASA